VIVGKPDLSKLPLIRSKKYLSWSNDAEAVAAEVQKLLRAAQPAPKTSVPQTAPSAPAPAARKATAPVQNTPPAAPWKPGWREPEETPPPPKQKKKKRGLFGWLFGKKQK
jgi:hypothetical protein